MLFLGLGTGVGSALITEEVILTLELGQLPYKRGETLGEALGRQGLKRLGKIAWRRAVIEVTPAKMVEIVQELAEGWDYDAISIGYPGLVGDQGRVRSLSI